MMKITIKVFLESGEVEMTAEEARRMFEALKPFFSEEKCYPQGDFNEFPYHGTPWWGIVTPIEPPFRFK